MELERKGFDAFGRDFREGGMLVDGVLQVSCLWALGLVCYQLLRCEAQRDPDEPNVDEVQHDSDKPNVDEGQHDVLLNRLSSPRPTCDSTPLAEWRLRWMLRPHLTGFTPAHLGWEGMLPHSSTLRAYWNSWLAAFIYTLAIEILTTGSVWMPRHCSILVRVIGASWMYRAGGVASRFVLLSVGTICLSNHFAPFTSSATLGSRKSFSLSTILSTIWVDIFWVLVHTNLLIDGHNNKSSSLLLAGCLVGTALKIAFQFAPHVAALEEYDGSACRRAWKLLQGRRIQGRRIGCALFLHAFVFGDFLILYVILLFDSDRLDVLKDRLDILKAPPSLSEAQVLFAIRWATVVAFYSSTVAAFYISCRIDEEDETEKSEKEI